MFFKAKVALALVLLTNFSQLFASDLRPAIKLAQALEEKMAQSLIEHGELLGQLKPNQMSIKIADLIDANIKTAVIENFDSFLEAYRMPTFASLEKQALSEAEKLKIIRKGIEKNIESMTNVIQTIRVQYIKNLYNHLSDIVDHSSVINSIGFTKVKTQVLEISTELQNLKIAVKPGVEQSIASLKKILSSIEMDVNFVKNLNSTLFIPNKFFLVGFPDPEQYALTKMQYTKIKTNAIKWFEQAMQKAIKIGKVVL